MLFRLRLPVEPPRGKEKDKLPRISTCNANTMMMVCLTHELVIRRRLCTLCCFSIEGTWAVRVLKDPVDFYHHKVLRKPKPCYTRIGKWQLTTRTSFPRAATTNLAKPRRGRPLRWRADAQPWRRSAPPTPWCCFLYICIICIKNNNN